MNFIWDCIYGLRVFAELDHLTPQSKWVSIDQYEKYSYTFDDVSAELENLYSLYLNNPGSQE